MTKFIGYTSLIFILGLFSCSKESVEPKLPKPNLTNIGESIIIGNTTNMIVKNYNHNVSAIGGVTFSFDIDNNGVHDYSIFSGYVQGQGGGGQASKISSLNLNYLLHGKLENNYLYSYSDTITYAGPSPWLGEIHNYISCDHINPNETINQIDSNRLHITPLDSSILLYNNSTFSSQQNIYLYQTSWSMSDSNPPWITQPHRYYNCDYFPLGVEKYIGIKTVINGQTKLGWIKIISRGYQVDLIKTAIQV